MSASSTFEVCGSVSYPGIVIEGEDDEGSDEVEVVNRSDGSISLAATPNKIDLCDVSILKIDSADEICGFSTQDEVVSAPLSRDHVNVDLETLCISESSTKVMANSRTHTSFTWFKNSGSSSSHVHEDISPPPSFSSPTASIYFFPLVTQRAEQLSLSYRDFRSQKLDLISKLERSRWTAHSDDETNLTSAYHVNQLYHVTRAVSLTHVHPDDRNVLICKGLQTLLGSVVTDIHKSLRDVQSQAVTAAHQADRLRRLYTYRQNSLDLLIRSISQLCEPST